MRTTGVSFDKDSREVLRLGRIEVKAAVAQLLRRAMRAYTTGQVNNFGADVFAAQMQRSVMRGAIVSHLLGVRSVMASVQVKRNRQLRLSFDELLSVLQLQLDMDVTELEQTYETDVLRVVKSTTDRVERSLRETLTDLIENRVRPTEAREQFRQAVNDLGLHDVSTHQVDAIFNTQAAISYHAGQWNGYQTPEVDEILWGYKYVSVGDSRVRPDHVAMDGTTLPKDHPFWATNWPPNGWNCRCVIIPIFEDREPVQPKEVKEGDDPPRPAGPDAGFNLNPGEVFNTSSPPKPKVSPNTPAKGAGQKGEGKPKTEPDAKPTIEKKLRPQVVADIATRPKRSGVLVLKPEEREALAAEIKNSKAVKRATFYMGAALVSIIGWELGKSLKKGQPIQIDDPHIGTPVLGDAIGEINLPEVIVRLRTRAGDVVLPMEDGRVIYPPGARYRIIDRRYARVRGRRVLTLTVERIK
jgi:SPP1 gp7 family putative phage head morphogenesis protein